MDLQPAASGGRLYTANRATMPFSTMPSAATESSGRSPPRDLPELMDEPDCDREALQDALRVLGQMGRHLGGHRLLRRQVDRVLRGRTPGPIGVLDIGAGGGDASLSLAAHLETRGWTPRLTLADRHAGALALCRERVRRRRADLPIEFVRLEAPELPFADGTRDLVISTMTLHHLEDDAASHLLAEMARVARVGWVLTDLRRSPLVLAAARLLAATVWRSHAFSRVDGPVSVRRSFTPDEIRRLLRGARLARATVVPRLIRWAARGTASA